MPVAPSSWLNKPEEPSGRSWFNIGNAGACWLATHGRHGELWIQHPHMSYWGRWSLWEELQHDGDEVLEHGRFVWWWGRWGDVPQGCWDDETWHLQ